MPCIVRFAFGGYIFYKIQILISYRCVALSLNLSPQVLACDALYLCAGLGAYTVKKHFDFVAWFQVFLGPALEALVSTMQTTAGQVRLIAVQYTCFPH